MCIKLRTSAFGPIPLGSKGVSSIRVESSKMLGFIVILEYISYGPKALFGIDFCVAQIYGAT